MCEDVDEIINNEWKVKLQTISRNDARSIDVKYHLYCNMKYV